MDMVIFSEVVDGFDFFFVLFKWIFIVIVGVLVWSTFKSIGAKKEVHTWMLRLGLVALVGVATILTIRGTASEFPSDDLRADVAGTEFRPGAMDNKIDDVVGWMVRKWRSAFREITNGLIRVLVPLEGRLLQIPWWLFISLVGLLAWRVSGHKIALVCVGSLLFLAIFELWDQSMRTVAVVGTATAISVMISVPVGITMSKNDRLQGVMRPILDGMQTMPSFVYLIPAIYFLGLGKVPAVMATVVYAMPPGMRLTNLGIRLVSAELKEAAKAFGTSPWQMLVKVELPMAKPTIMAGINQTVMMALAMVVVASLVGAGGLGNDVLKGIQSLEFGKGLMAGLGIVAIAVVIDRISQGFAKGVQGQGTH